MCVHLDSMILPKLDENKPCYIFYRLDERNSHQNYLWVFMSYTPDTAQVCCCHLSLGYCILVTLRLRYYYMYAVSVVFSYVQYRSLKS